MSELTEVKEIFKETQKIVETLRSENEIAKKQLADVVTEEKLSRIQSELAAKLEAEQKASQEYKSRLDALETQVNRPNGAGEKAKADEYQVKFNEYVKSGQGEIELKAMSTNVQANGGFAVPDVMAQGIQERMRRSSPVRSVANVVSMTGGNYSRKISRGAPTSGWVGEQEARPTTDAPTVHIVNVDWATLYAKPEQTEELIGNADFDIESWLIGELVDEFARQEATAFVAGNGVKKPKGFLSYSVATDADKDRAVETLQYKFTGASGAFATSGKADVLVKTFYELHERYQANAVWMMKNTTAAEVATLKDDNGAYLLQSALSPTGQFARTIEGRPIALADDMPAIAANSLSIAVGDFSRGYTIIDNDAVRVLRDPYSNKGYVQFYTTKRVGGGVTDFDAIKLIKFGTA